MKPSKNVALATKGNVYTKKDTEIKIKLYIKIFLKQIIIQMHIY